MTKTFGCFADTTAPRLAMNGYRPTLTHRARAALDSSRHGVVKLGNAEA
jgi:hypothetical protein